MRQAAKVYFETQVTTTSQGQILIMLYDGAIKFLTQAKERMEAKDYAGKGKLISSAIDVINELASSLNAEKGGDLAANLSQLYFYCNKRLFTANARMDTAPLDEVIKILGGIRSAYVQIVDSPEVVEAMAQAQAKAAQAKGPRAPMGGHKTPVGAPVPTARAHNAYAVHTAATAQAQEANAVEQSATPVAAQAPASPEPEKIPVAEIPVAEAVAPAALVAPVAPVAPEIPAMPDLESVAAAPLPGFAQAKHMAASNLYRKFAS